MWGALISAGLSIIGGMQEKKKAKKQQKAADKANQQQMAMLQQNMDFARGEYDSWKGRFDPVYGQLQEMADDDRVDYSGVVGDATAAYDSAIGQQRREAQRYGLNPADGDPGARAGLGKAASVVDAMNRQRMDNKDKRWDRYSGLASLAGSGMSAATGMVSGAMNTMAGAFGQQGQQQQARADASGAASSNAFGAAGQIIGGVDWGSAMGKAFASGPQPGNVNPPRAGMAGVNDRTPFNFRSPGPY